MRKHKIIDFEIVDHGYDHAQYFQGCGTYGTVFDEVYTGAGDNAKDAYEQAMEQVYMAYGDASDRLPRRPRGIRKSDHVPRRLTKDEESEYYWYVSIRVQVIGGGEK
jgi:hypothetical protein